MLRDSMFRALIETLPDAVVIADRDGTILLVNAQVEALFGYEREELVEQPVEVLVPDGLRAAHIAHRVAFVRQPGTRPMGNGLELAGRRKDGSTFPVEISLSPLVRGQEMFVTGVIRDVSERNRLRSELETQHERERIAMDLHDGTIQSIYAVGLGLELALADIVREPVASGKLIDSAIEQLNAVIGDIRGYIFDLRAAEFDGDLLTELGAIIEEFRALAPLDVAADMPAALPEVREERAVAMLHIAREALSNARKHAKASALIVALTAGDEFVELEIRDDGVGFAQTESVSELHRGLRNMRLRTQRLGGTFDVESAPGAGTVLRVRMPCGH